MAVEGLLTILMMKDFETLVDCSSVVLAKMKWLLFAQVAYFQFLVILSLCELYLLLHIMSRDSRVANREPLFSCCSLPLQTPNLQFALSYNLVFFSAQFVTTKGSISFC